MKRSSSLPLHDLKKTALGAAILVTGCSRPTVELDIPKILEAGKRYCKKEYPKEYEVCAVAYAKAVEKMEEELRHRIQVASRDGGDWFGPALVGYMLGRDLGGGYYGGGYYGGADRQQPTSVPPPKLRTPPKPQPTRTIQRGGFGSKAIGRFGWGG